MAITELSPALSVTCEALYIPFVDGVDVDNAPEFQQLVCDVIFKPNTKEDGVILVAGTAKGIIANTFTFLNVGDPAGTYPWPFDEQIVNLADTDLNPSGANYTVTIKPKGYVSATNTVVPLEGWADRVGILVCEAGTNTTPLLQWMPLESASDGIAYLIGPAGSPGPAGPAATVAVGTTTTGAAGSSATVTNSGSSSAAVLNFTIPQGVKGDTGSPTAYELRGTGMPNGVVTASPGTYYTDTAGTNGAWRWLKTSGTGNTGWLVVFGDTGWRNISASQSNISGMVTVRRIGASVFYTFNDVRLVTPTDRYLVTIPSGFEPTTNPGALYGHNGTTWGFNFHTINNSATIWAVSNAMWLRASMSSITTSDWPTVLPGTAA